VRAPSALGDQSDPRLARLTCIGDLDSLELLTLYGLPQVRSLPSLTRLERLRRVEVGSMKGIDGLGPLLDAWP
jgi:hypothetical protein